MNTFAYLPAIVLKTFVKKRIFTFYVKELLLFVEELYCYRRFACFFVPHIFEYSCPPVSTKALIPGPPSDRSASPVYKMVKYLHITFIYV